MAKDLLDPALVEVAKHREIPRLTERFLQPAYCPGRLEMAEPEGLTEPIDGFHEDQTCLIDPTLGEQDIGQIMEDPQYLIGRGTDSVIPVHDEPAKQRLGRIPGRRGPTGPDQSVCRACSATVWVGPK